MGKVLEKEASEAGMEGWIVKENCVGLSGCGCHCEGLKVLVWMSV